MASQTLMPASTRLKIISGWSLKTIANMMGTRHGAIGATILLLLALIAIIAPFVAPYHPLQQTPVSLSPPSSQFLFGTDNIGRDVFSLLLYGDRSSLMVQLGAALATLLVG